jgi:hypothetical protein
MYIHVHHDVSISETISYYSHHCVKLYQYKNKIKTVIYLQYTTFVKTLVNGVLINSGLTETE